MISTIFSAILTKTNNFIAKDIKIKIHKNFFNNPVNDPRIKGASSKKYKIIL